ncbi:uncharacterized protein METZ01_LOCUS150166, partial [marine metagenome]
AVQHPARFQPQHRRPHGRAVAKGIGCVEGL